MDHSFPWSAFAGKLFLTIAIAFAAGQAQADDIGVQVPEGFEVTEYASDELAHNIYSLTIDSKGRVVVAGSGYVKILIDQDGDGKAESAKVFSELPKNGAQGMYFNGRSLICIGDAGLLRLKDADGDDKADGPPEVFLKLKTGGEHDVHSIQQGPDGWWYVIAGNSSGIDGRYATLPSSPIKQPRAGVLFRLKPDLTGGELLSDGLRNTYDFAFNTLGDLFTYDSDEEREISLPWYRPTRVYHALIGSDHGWVSKSWMRKQGFFDMPPSIATFGRGSPTGVVCYRHRQFPEKYQGALFTLDWTYGRVHAIPMKVADDTWEGEPELFMSGTGQNGFAPTDIEVGPDGSLYVSVGGRGTRGSVYRIRHKSESSEPKPLEAAPLTKEQHLANVLTADQPLSSWSRAKWKPVAMEFGAATFRAVALDEAQPAASRIRAIEILLELFQGVDAELVKTLATASVPEVRARAIWGYLRTSTVQRDPEIITTYLNDTSALVARCTLEGCLTIEAKSFDWSKIISPLAARLGSADRYNRALAAALVTRVDDRILPSLSTEATKNGHRAVVSYAIGWLSRTTDQTQRFKSVIPPIAIAVLKKAENSVSLKLDAVRLLQMAIGDMGPQSGRPSVFDGYASSAPLEQWERELDPLRVQLAEIYPTGAEKLDEELARLFAMLTTYSGKVIDAMCDRMTEQSDPVDDIHLLVCLARCPMTHTVKQRDAIVRTLVELEEKISVRKLPQDASWADRIKETWIKLATADQFLAPAIVGHPKFGRPGHTLFLNQMPPELLQTAREAFVKMIEADDDYAWSNDVVFALAESTDPAHRKLLKQQFDRFSVRGAVLVVLSRSPEQADRELFVTGLEWSQTEVQTACLSALEKLGPNNNPKEQVTLVKSLRRLGADETEFVARESVVRLLERNNKIMFPFERGKAGYRPQPEAIEKWTRWLEGRFPAEAAAELGSNNQELTELKAILAETDWESGDINRGAELFNKRSCRQCHSGRLALGPDLAGVASRFSREDLFTAIVIPSRDVSSRYQTTVIAARDGKSYSGLVIYESVDGLLLRNGTGQTFRIEASQIEFRRKSPVSLMPVGLLKGLTPKEHADLYAYLKSISNVQTANNPKDSKEASE